jgi:acyl-CoA thioester hydrolase
MYTGETEIDVRYYETDLMGIVHHSNYIRYFEFGRVKALDDVGLPMTEIEKSGFMMPVVSVNLNYKTPSSFGDKLKIVTIIKELPRVTVTIDTIIYNQLGQEVCNGSVKLGFIHSDSRKVTRCPKNFIDAFAPYFDKQL